MPLFQIPDNELIFPPLHKAEPDGLLAIGGDLSMERLLLAYRSGIFPWYNRKPILWWSPDPRFVLFPAELKVSNSMKQLLRKSPFRISINENFAGVISNCSSIEREGQDGTWITKDMMAAYLQLHEAGYALSVECWQNEELVGGLYGLKIGRCFFGESMFAKVSNASKAAFITFIQQYENELAMVDCQVHTHHLASLGARFISRITFADIVQRNL
ncbi:leucyl/phenylalanyl-tRNA--protein transferase [Chitinophaga sp. SYP-B3965]|uniref:leucyl/phenylalanyl-tRNA--protein transferase n=1 Tax=Chitinophaga sp. SYP-B3965 TaxID=2663120 RepID=UPI001299995F|nr:leucyl/phenylalanyl-tRNA--protein transferase [Chitinophaga sp. SYP-B3965]MRG47181.1 leucyl/phenylalanyl-tRNA--protein transferase [Chitinophaga sp. SYP-B3965]